jgi:hypothetical protein
MTEKAKRQLGPNVKRLMIERASIEAVPVGGGMASAIDFLLDKKKTVEGFRRSLEWCDSAIQTLRSAGEPNPFKNSSDEEIAGEILRVVSIRREAHKA